VDSFGVSAPNFGARVTPYEHMTCGTETRRSVLLAIVHSLYTALYTAFEKEPHFWHSSILGKQVANEFGHL
jgi:hypothetical protein